MRWCYQRCDQASRLAGVEDAEDKLFEDLLRLMHESLVSSTPTVRHLFDLQSAQGDTPVSPLLIAAKRSRVCVRESKVSGQGTHRASERGLPCHGHGRPRKRAHTASVAGRTYPRVNTAAAVRGRTLVQLTTRAV